MVYLVTQTVLLLAVAYLLGMLFGWLLRGRSRPAQAEDSDRRLVDALRAEREELKREIAGLEQRNESAGERIAALEAEREAAGGVLVAEGGLPDEPPPVNPGAEPDDLTQIFGIGPYINSKLAQLGITSYRQVAAFDDERIEYVGRHIGYFPDRIRREDWPGVAASLHRAKYGEEPKG